VGRAVWERDKRQWTLVSESGHRCNSRTLLELDHIDPVARGGTASEGNLRLRCRAHNQYEAERILGAGFMSQKRREARALRERPREELRKSSLKIPAGFVKEPAATYHVRGRLTGHRKESSRGPKQSASRRHKNKSDIPRVRLPRRPRACGRAPRMRSLALARWSVASGSS